MGILDKISTIIEAWIISNNPSDRQKELSKKRIKVCSDCESLNHFLKICGECGCPISKKIFTNEENPCPLKKWEDVDKEYFIQKTKKTIL